MFEKSVPDAVQMGYLHMSRQAAPLIQRKHIACHSVSRLNNFFFFQSGISYHVLIGECPTLNSIKNLFHAIRPNYSIEKCSQTINYRIELNSVRKSMNFCGKMRKSTNRMKHNLHCVWCMHFNAFSSHRIE